MCSSLGRGCYRNSFVYLLRDIYLLAFCMYYVLVVRCFCRDVFEGRKLEGRCLCVTCMLRMKDISTFRCFDSAIFQCFNIPIIYFSRLVLGTTVLFFRVGLRGASISVGLHGILWAGLSTHGAPQDVTHCSRDSTVHCGWDALPTVHYGKH